MIKFGSIPFWISAPLIGATFGILLWWEWRRPLRRAVESKLRRNARNLSTAAINVLTLRIVEFPLVVPLSMLVTSRGWGLLPQANLPLWLETALTFVLLDYTLYIWHVLTHRVPRLWRFHVVHHVDLDLDASTALRFHAGEMVISVAWRAGQVILIGVSPFALSVWQVGLLLSILFHHANVRLPIEIERWLNSVLVTPRMHGIHHSTVRAETDSNWSSGLTIWDWLHGTLRLDVPQEAITIGVPAYQKSQEVSFAKIVALPFVSQRPTWRDEDGSESVRVTLQGTPARLMNLAQ
jgi:sterol desaturase/sphingolipid hydroxylase (fatty acid hydroxylase superfamily)